MSILDYIKQILGNQKKTATIYTKTLTKKYGEPTPLTVGLYDHKDPLPNRTVLINVNGKDYQRTTNEQGIATLNINLNPDEYTPLITFIDDDYNLTTAFTKITITSETRLDGINLTKTYGDSTPYQCAVYDQFTGQRITGTVNLTVNGKTYTRTPDNTGLYKLNINLSPGIYELRAEYLGDNIHLPSTITNTIIITEPQPEPPKPQPTYSQEILEYFESKFGKMTCIDDCLEAIQGNGYGYYYDDQYSNYTSINRMANYQGVNCTDSCQVFWHLGKALGYDVRCLHIGCNGGDGHVRLQFNRGDGWFHRDPAAVLNGNSITSIWCSNGTLWDTNPDWFLENVNR